MYSFLTVRAVCKEGLSKLLLLREELKRRDETEGATTAEKRRGGGGGGGRAYRSDDFRNLLNLVAQEEHLDGEDWFLRALIAAYLLRLLMITK